MKAIAAMARNRVIGAGGKIPWHLPEDFRWFKQATLGGTLIMGRKTFESLPGPLPGRKTYVLTHRPMRFAGELQRRLPRLRVRVGSAAHPRSRPLQLVLPGPPGTELYVARGLRSLARAGLLEAAWLAGGAQLYEQFLRHCDELYLTRVKADVAGDAFFPPFEDAFEFAEKVRETPEFEILRYRNLRLEPVEGARR